MPEYTDAKGHRIISGGLLEPSEQQAIFDYVTKMELAIEINKNRRLANGNTSFGASIVDAIFRAGIVTKHSITLYRKVRALHDNVVTGVRDVCYQHTIISTTDSSASVGNWGGNYVYEIKVPSQQRVIIVEHTLIGMKFLEYLLPPGYFLYSDKENYKADNPTHRIAYMQSRLGKEQFSELAMQLQLFRTLFPSMSLGKASAISPTEQLLAMTAALTRGLGPLPKPSNTDEPDILAKLSIDISYVSTTSPSILVAPPAPLRIPKDSEVFQTEEQRAADLQRILEQYSEKYPGIK